MRTLAIVGGSAISTAVIMSSYLTWRARSGRGPLRQRSALVSGGLIGALAAAVIMLLTGCASTNTPRSDMLAWPADVACSLPDPTGIFLLASCGASLAIRGVSGVLSPPESKTFERRPTTPTSGGTWDVPDAAK